MATVAIIGCCRVHGPGDARSGDRAPGARGRRARLRLARREAGVSHSTRGSNGDDLAASSSRTARRPRPARTSSSSAWATSRRRAFDPPDGAVVVDLSGAHRLRDEAQRRRLVRDHPGSVELRAARAVSAARAADREPGLLRDGRAARARAGRGLDPERGDRREVRRLGRRPDAQAELARERPCSRTSRRTRSASTATRPRSPRQLGFPVCFVPHLLPVRRGLLATCYARADVAAVRDRLEETYADSRVVRVLPESVVPELARVQGTDAAEVAVFEDGATGTAIVVCALDNLGKGAAGPGAPEREPRARPRRDGGPAAARSARMSITAADGFVASGVHAGIRRRARDLALVRSLAARDGRRDVHGESRAGRAGHHLEGASRARGAPGGRRELRRRRTPRPASAGARRARDRRRGGAAPRPRSPRRCSSSRPA